MPKSRFLKMIYFLRFILKLCLKLIKVLILSI